MKLFEPRGILAATDFSEVSTAALRHAVLWARRYHAHLTVLYVQEPPPIWSDPYLGSYNLAGLVEAVWTAATQQLDQYLAQHVPSDIPVTRELRSGSPPEVIEEYAAGQAIDLVVLGTHGRGGINRLLLGSVAERTLHQAQRPTLIVGQFHSPEASDAASPRLRHILCPVNYSEVAHTAFEHAVAVARAFAARLTAVFAAEQEQPTPEELRRAEDQLRAWLPAGSEAKCWIQAVVRPGNAAEQVITLARETGADLVVIGAQHRRFVDSTVLGVTTVRVTRHTPCPVLVVPRSNDE
jgi:nucleotide-binding universal stress UspA family protein